MKIDFWTRQWPIALCRNWKCQAYRRLRYLIFSLTNITISYFQIEFYHQKLYEFCTIIFNDNKHWIHYFSVLWYLHFTRITPIWSTILRFCFNENHGKSKIHQVTQNKANIQNRNDKSQHNELSLINFFFISHIQFYEKIIFYDIIPMWKHRCWA